MPLHPQRDCFDPLQQKKCIKGRKNGTHRALVNAAGALDVCACSELPRIDHPVIGFVRLAERSKALWMLRPREAPAVDDRAAERCAMSSKKFRQRMDDNVGAVVEWLEKNRRGHRIVDYQRNALTVGYFGERFNVADIAGRISD